MSRCPASATHGQTPVFVIATLSAKGLPASTVNAARSANFLSVFLPFREGDEDNLPKIERLAGEGAVGVRLAWPDGATDVVGFRTDSDANTVRCGGMASEGVAFARGTDSQGRSLRKIEQPQD